MNVGLTLRFGLGQGLGEVVLPAGRAWEQGRRVSGVSWHRYYCWRLGLSSRVDAPCKAIQSMGGVGVGG